jgi:antitoxin ParD1/3/4
MSTMNISLPEELKAFVDQQVKTRGYTSSSEYLRELIRKEQDRAKLRGLLLEGLESGPGRAADAAYFDGLRERIHRHARSDPASPTGGAAQAARRGAKAGVR